jgi:RNA polymerase sigma-70 factor (ECF subfamily)
LDSSTLQRWYELYGFAVYRRCLGFLGSEAEAQDAMHEVFLRARRYDHTRQGEELLPWLYRIADRHCLNLLGKRKRFAAGAEAEAALTARENAPSGAASPERVRLVGQVLAACKERVRRAATLYYVDELTQDEVADALGVSRKTVKEKLQQFKDTAARVLGSKEVSNE